MAAKIKEKIDASVEGKLKSLYQLQLIDSKIDRLRTVRGELPLEVSDLEDTVLGLETRLKNVELEVSELDTTLNEKKQAIKDLYGEEKSYSFYKTKEREMRKARTISKVNMQFDLSVDDDDVADSIAIGWYASENWHKLVDQPHNLDKKRG